MELWSFNISQRHYQKKIIRCTNNRRKSGGKKYWSYRYVKCEYMVDLFSSATGNLKSIAVILVEITSQNVMGNLYDKPRKTHLP